MRNKLTGMMMLAAAAVGLIGCSDKLTDESGGTNGLEGSESYVYMNVAISLPTDAGTRSGTEDGPFGDTGDNQTNSDEDKKNGTDYEYGYANENTVRTVYLVLATEKDEYITHELLENNSTVSDAVTERYSFIATQKFDREAINKAYENGGLLATNKTVHVYAFCNPTEALKENLTKLKNTLKTDKDASRTDWLNWTETLTESNRIPDVPIWGTEANDFLMSNAQVCTVTFPPTKEEWDQYSRESNPFHLSANNNPVRVERTAARLDYRDGSASEENYGKDSEDNDLVGYRYNFNLKKEDKTEINLVSVALTHMSLVNMSNEYYYLRRVSNDGTWTPNTQGKGICGVETPSNYVVDTDWNVKQSDHDGITPQNASTYFNYPVYFASDGVSYNYSAWDNYLISEVLKGKDDTWKGSADKRYHIWRYVTENTIPDSESQKHVQSVGVVFKGRLIAGDNVNAEYTEGETTVSYLSETTQEILKKASLPKASQIGLTRSDFPPLYNFNNLFYAGFEDLVACAAKEKISSSLYISVNNILSHWYYIEGAEGNNGTKTFIYRENEPKAEEGQDPIKFTRLSVTICNDIINNGGGDNYEGYTIDFLKDGKVDISNLTKLIVDQKITTNFAEEDGDFGIGYYCYYFYWNRHNDNGKPSQMGPMEFATVRNNVYKLSVTAIKQPGHPTNPSNDPDPVRPEDPDESDDIYMDVTVEVLPWVVRVNDIEF